MGQPPVKSVEDKNRIVLAVLRGEVTIAEVARRENTSQVSISKWRDQFLAGGLEALAQGARHGPSSRELQMAAEVEQLNTALGEAHMELRLWRKGGVLYPGGSSSKRPA
jgi:transposase